MAQYETGGVWPGSIESDGSLAAQVAASDAAALRLAGDRSLQNDIWQEYCDTVLPARQAVFETTLACLREVLPVRFLGAWGAEWEFERQGMVGSTSVRQVSTVRVGLPERSAASSQLAAAADYLNTTNPKRSPKELLGVTAVRRSGLLAVRDRQIPRQELMRQYRDTLLADIGWLSVGVTDVLEHTDEGSFSLHTDVVRTKWHNPDDPNARPELLLPQNAETARQQAVQKLRPSIADRIPEARHADSWLSAEQLETFLRGSTVSYCMSDSVDSVYQRLAEANDILLLSQPLTPTATA